SVPAPHRKAKPLISVCIRDRNLRHPPPANRDVVVRPQNRSGYRAARISLSPTSARVSAPNLWSVRRTSPRRHRLATVRRSADRKGVALGAGQASSPGARALRAIPLSLSPAKIRSEERRVGKGGRCWVLGEERKE